MNNVKLVRLVVSASDTQVRLIRREAPEAGEEDVCLVISLVFRAASPSPFTRLLKTLAVRLVCMAHGGLLSFVYNSSLLI